MEASIHNSSGVSSIQEDDTRIREADAPGTNDAIAHETEAALGLQQLSAPNGISQHSPYVFEGLFADELSDFNQWNHVWPLWGEQQSGALAAGGFQFDYELGHDITDF